MLKQGRVHQAAFRSSATEVRSPEVARSLGCTDERGDSPSRMDARWTPHPRRLIIPV